MAQRVLPKGGFFYGASAKRNNGFATVFEFHFFTSLVSVVLLVLL
jgi:hypothetical protein